MPGSRTADPNRLGRPQTACSSMWKPAAASSAGFLLRPARGRQNRPGTDAAFWPPSRLRFAADIATESQGQP